ncbi:MAG: hypothetical protein ACFB9M_16975 [Myxococcota bacterium]
MLITRLVQKTQWGQLLSLVSPSFFEVLPTKSLRTEVGALMKSASDRAGFQRRLEARKPLMQAFGWSQGHRGTHFEEVDGKIGSDLLAFYFAQLYSCDDLIPDLRSTTFKSEEGTVFWGPRTLYVDWSPDFIRNLRQLYTGFYEGDDAAYEGALSGLGLPGTGDLFRDHFGANQDAVHFDLARFQETFHRIFERCRTQRLRLHHHFVSFGIYLGTLYENLDRAGQPFDCAVAYRRGRDLATTVGSDSPA